MRTNEERIAAMHRRAAELKIEQRRRQARFAGATGVALCLALVILLALWMPGASAAVTGSSMPAGMSASIFAGSGALGYLVVAIVAFLLGVCVTVFCVRLRKWRDETDPEDRP